MKIGKNTSFKGIKTDLPLFLKTGDSNPVSLFVGSYNAAAVDDKGSVLFIPAWLKNSPETEIEASTLPGDEKAMCVACCIDTVFVVSENGKLFACKLDELKEKSCKLNFTQIDLFKGEKIISVSGTYNHCLAVSEKGKVFGFGSNEFSKLGFKKDIENIEQFTKIQSLSKFKIKYAYAGLCHSLFITQKNVLLALGDAQFGQLFTNSLINEPFSEPIETEIGNATFCIAGDSFSCVFLDCEPLNSPNRCIKFENHENIETLRKENDYLKKIE